MSRDSGDSVEEDAATPIAAHHEAYDTTATIAGSSTYVKARIMLASAPAPHRPPMSQPGRRRLMWIQLAGEVAAALAAAREGRHEAEGPDEVRSPSS